VHFSRCLKINLSRDGRTACINFLDGDEVMSEGKSFHRHVGLPATGKARRPTVERLTAATGYWW